MHIDIDMDLYMDIDLNIECCKPWNCAIWWSLCSNHFKPLHDQATEASGESDVLTEIREAHEAGRPGDQLRDRGIFVDFLFLILRTTGCCHVFFFSKFGLFL